MNRVGFHRARPENHGGIRERRKCHTDEEAEEFVIPIVLETAVYALEREVIPRRIGDAEIAHIADPVPHRDLDRLGLGGSGGVEHVPHAGQTHPALRNGMTGKCGDPVSDSGTLRLRVGVAIREQCGRIDPVGQGGEGKGGRGLRRGEGGLEESHRVFPAVLDAGAGQNVVEMGEQGVLPRGIQGMVRHIVARAEMRHSDCGLGFE